MVQQYGRHRYLFHFTDPQSVHKNGILQSHWDTDYLKKGMEVFEKLFDEYPSKFGDGRPKVPGNTGRTMQEDTSGSGNMGYSSAWMQNTVQARVQAENANADPCREVAEYLAGPLNVLCTDILKWWQEHEVQFPILARIT